MKLFIRTQDGPLSDELGTHVRRSVQFALTRFRGRIIRTHVHLATVSRDASDPTCEDEDVECVVRVDLQAGSVVARDIDEEPTYAVSQAIERIGQIVARYEDSGVAAQQSVSGLSQRTAG